MKKKSIVYFIIGLVGLFGASMIIHTVINNTSFYYDDAVYWGLGQACGWDVKNMSWGFRGWLLPYIFSMCYKFGMLFDSEMLGYRLFSSAVFAFTFAVLLKYVIQLLDFKIKEEKTVLLGGICVGSLFFLFFRGLFIYTLSDFYAFSLSLCSILLLNRIVEYEQKIYIKALEAFFLGLCLYGTYNIRTIYLFSLIACIAVLLVWQLYQKKWLQIMVTLPSCFGGMMVCSIPQIILNHHLLGNYSWKVPTEGLMLFQLHCGISTGRYATYIGDKSQYGEAGMFFVDAIGRAILEKEQITEFTSYGQFFKLIFKYPLDFMGIYVRHFLNMLYPIYPNQYIQDITRDKTLLLWLFYTILFIAIFYFIHSFKIKSKRWIWFALILLPCICILPGAVEIRFFIALHFLIYLYAVLGIKEFIIQVKEHKFKYILAYIIGFLLYVAYAGMLLATTNAGIAIIHG